MELEVIDQKVLVFVVKRMWAQLQPQGVASSCTTRELGGVQ